jgi:hypothetical protein
MSKDGRYSEAGISKRQTVGVSPDERHSLCEWQMQEQLSVIRAILGAHLSGQRVALLKIAPGNFLFAPSVALTFQANALRC